MCKCVSVCELTGSFSLALEVNRKRRGVVFFLRISGSGGQGGSITLFLLIAVGAFWKAREFEPGH